MFSNMDCQLDDDVFNCFCGFETQSGTDMARHVYFCRFGECELPKKGKAIPLPQGGTMKHGNEKFSIKSLQHNAVPISSLGKSYTNSAPFTQSNQSQRKPGDLPPNLPPVPSLVQEPVVKLLNNGNPDAVLGFTNDSSNLPRNTSDDRLRPPPVLVAQAPVPPLITPSSADLINAGNVAASNAQSSPYQTVYSAAPVCTTSQTELSPTFIVDDPFPHSPPDASLDVPTVVPAEAPNLNVLTGREEDLNFNYDIFKVPVSLSMESNDATAASISRQSEVVSANSKTSPLMDAFSVLPDDMQHALFGSLDVENGTSTLAENRTNPESSNSQPQSSNPESQPNVEKSPPSQKHFGSFLASYMQSDALKTPPRKKAKKLDAAISTLLQKQNLDDAGPS